MRKSSGVLLVGLLVAFTMAYYFGDAREIVQYVADEIENF